MLSSGSVEVVVPRQFFGKIHEYTPGSDFESYMELVQYFFETNQINDKKSQKSCLMISIGTEVYEKMRALIHPRKPQDIDIDEIWKVLANYYSPKTHVMTERFKFLKSTQMLGESMQDFVARIKHLAEKCNFGSYIPTDLPNCTELRKKALEEYLRDQLILGVADAHMQQQLLSKVEPTFEECVLLATNLESSRKNQESLAGNTYQVNAVRSRQVNFHKGGKADGRDRSRSRSAYHSPGRPKSATSKKHVASEQATCNRCGKSGANHTFTTCPAKKYVCHICSRRGHISSVCDQRESAKTVRETSNMVKVTTAKKSVQDRLGRRGEEPEPSPVKECQLQVEGQSTVMEVDTGSASTLFSCEEYKQKFSQIPLKKVTNFVLSTVTGTRIRVLGSVTLTVTLTSSRSYKLDAIVIATGKKFMALMGRRWLDRMYPNWRNLMVGPGKTLVESNVNANVEVANSISSLIRSKYPSLVSSCSKTFIKNHEAMLHINKCIPIFHKAYSVPLRYREKVGEEIDRLEQDGIITTVTHSEWASPVVVVPKPDGSIRLCVDCGVTINQFLKTIHYPMPNIEEIFASLSNCSVFSVLDLTGAYQQLKVSECSKPLLTINTHKGLYQFNRLPFGVSSAPSIFQKVMDQILIHITNVCCYLDDIIVGGKDEADCKKTLCVVFQRLSDHNVKINLKKCKFLQKTVEYLGHVLSCNKVEPNPKKIRAIVDAPSPSNVQQLQSYLGLLNYYRRFIPNLSTQLHVLHNLLNKDVPFDWSNECQAVFLKTKTLVVSHNVLVLFDPDKPIVITTDASSYGVGAVMSHIINGDEKPVMFASSSLNAAQKNYSSLHREGLAIVTAVAKFHNYIYGKPFTIVTDHQALKEIFDPSHTNSAVAATRLQRWSVILGMYDYKIIHRPGKKVGHADALSRLPLSEVLESDECVNFVDVLSEISIDFSRVQASTMQDEDFRNVYGFLMTDWPLPTTLNVVCLTLYKLRKSLSTEDGCIFYGDRIVVPQILRSYVLNQLHSSHTGIVRMKTLARSYVFWPNIDKDIQQCVADCNVCQMTRNVNKEVVTSSWPQTTYPFERIHLDFFMLAGRTFLILVDSYSKYIEVKSMKRTTAHCLLDELQKFFVVFGLPQEIVTDNGPPFSSFEFKNYCTQKSIKLTHSPPYHPQSNGLAERAVQTMKTTLKKCLLDNANCLCLDDKVTQCLYQYRNKMSTVTNKTPNELVLAYKPRTSMDLINPRSQIKSILKPSQSSDRRNIHSPKKSQNVVPQKAVKPTFSANDPIYYRNHFKNDVKWIPATYLKQLSRYTFLIRLNGNVRTVHRNQFRESQLCDKYPQYQNVVPLPTGTVPDRGVHRSKRKRSSTSSPEIPRRSKRIRGLLPVSYKE